MATNTLSILKPSVNNLTTRIFVRAAGLDFDEVDVEPKSTPEFLAKDPADLTPLLGRPPRARCGRLRDHAVPRQHGHATDPGERAMVDNDVLPDQDAVPARRPRDLSDARVSPVPVRSAPRRPTTP